jgi:hypothetical protein
VRVPEHSLTPCTVDVLSFLLKLRTRAQRLFRLSDAHTMLVWSVVVGIAGAFATILFREAIALLQRAVAGRSGSFVEMARSLPWTVRIWLPAAGGLIAGFFLLIAQRHADKANHVDYMEAVAIGDGVVPVRLSLWRSVSSLFTIASGGSIGREGPMVQLGTGRVADRTLGAFRSVAAAPLGRLRRGGRDYVRVQRADRGRVFRHRDRARLDRNGKLRARGGLGGGGQHHHA